MEITGTDGIVRVPNMWLPPKRATYEVQREGKPTEEVVVESEDQIVRMLEHLGDAALHGRPVQPAPEEAVKTLRVLDALAKSAREGRPVDV
jgi:predicted dehydrogenase